MKSPNAAQIMLARESAGLTQSAAGELIHSGLRSWQSWEYGKRKMDPAKWHLFLILSNQPHLVQNEIQKS